MGATMWSSSGALAVESEVYERTVQRFREGSVALPTFARLANPELITWWWCALRSPAFLPLDIFF
jgi:hypothetical protein